MDKMGFIFMLISIFGAIVFTPVIIILVRKFKKERANPVPTPAAPVQPPTIDPATIAMIRAASQNEDDGQQPVNDIDELDEEGLKGIQREANALQNQKAAEEESKAAAMLKQSSAEMFGAEGVALTAQGRRKIRLDEQETLDNRETALKAKHLEDRLEALDNEIKMGKKEIEEKAKLAREGILSQEKIDLEKQAKALDEIERQKAVKLKELNEQAKIKRAEIEEQSKLDKQDFKRRQDNQNDELSLKTAREESDRRSRINAKREQTENLINDLRIKNAMNEGKKSLSFGQVMLRWSVAAVMLASIIMIVGKYTN